MLDSRVCEKDASPSVHVQVCMCLILYFLKNTMLLPSAASGVAWTFTGLIDGNEVVLEGFHIYDVVAYLIL